MSGSEGAFNSLGEGLLLSDGGELDQEGKIDAGDDFDAAALKLAYGKIGGRSAEQVRQKYDPVAFIRLLDGVFHVLAPACEIVIRSYAYGDHVPLGPDHVLGGGNEFLRQVAVSDKHQSDHIASLAIVGPRRFTGTAPKPANQSVGISLLLNY